MSAILGALLLGGALAAADRYHPGEEFVFVKISSMRALDKVKRSLGEKPKEFFSFHHKDHIFAVPATRLPEISKIKGVTKTKWKDGFMPTIKAL